MKKKNKKIEFVAYNDNIHYEHGLKDTYSGLDRWTGSPDDDPSVLDLNVEERYKEYAGKLYPEAILPKEEYEKIIKQLVDFQKLGRKLTVAEADYLFELWRAIEPKRADLYLYEHSYSKEKREKLFKIRPKNKGSKAE